MISKTIRYNKLWKILVDKKIRKSDLRKAVDFASNTLIKPEQPAYVYQKYVASKRLSEQEIKEQTEE